MVEAMGIKIIASRSPWHHLPNKFHENLPSVSKDIHRSLTPKASKAVGPFLPYSKQLALFAMVTSLPLFRFGPAVNYMHWLPHLHQLTIVCGVTTETQQCKQSKNHCCARLKIMYPTNNFEPQPF
jgi:hypothetical protein